MLRAEKEHRLMARKLWCDVYKTVIVTDVYFNAEELADEAYRKFMSKFKRIDSSVCRDEKGRFKSCEKKQ